MGQPILRTLGPNRSLRRRPLLRCRKQQGIYGKRGKSGHVAYVTHIATLALQIVVPVNQRHSARRRNENRDRQQTICAPVSVHCASSYCPSQRSRNMGYTAARRF